MSFNACPSLYQSLMPFPVSSPSCDNTMHDPQHRADGFGLAGEQEAQRHRDTQHPLPHLAAGRTPPPPDAAHSRPCAARRSWGKTHASCRKTPAAATPGFLPYALRASLRLFKFVPDEFVRMALLAHHAQEAVLKHAAAQERLELLAHVRGQRAVLRRKTRNESQPQDLAYPLPRRVCGMQGQGTLAFLSLFARRLGVDRSARLLSAPGGPAGQAATVVLRTQG